MAVKYYSVYNACIAGTMAGAQVGRKTLISAANAPDQVEPADFATQLAAAQTFATEVDAILQSAGGTTPANLAALVSDGATVVPASASVANASQSLPAGMAALATAMWSGTSFPPVDSSGDPWDAAEYQPFANSLAAQFLEYCSGTNNS